MLEIFNLILFINVFMDFIFVHKCPSVSDICGTINNTMILPALKLYCAHDGKISLINFNRPELLSQLTRLNLRESEVF